MGNPKLKIRPEQWNPPTDTIWTSVLDGDFNFTECTEVNVGDHVQLQLDKDTDDEDVSDSIITVKVTEFIADSVFLGKDISSLKEIEFSLNNIFSWSKG